MKHYVALLLWQLGRERNRILIFTLAVTAFTALMMAISDSVKPADLQELLDKMPREARAFMKLKAGMVFTIERWLAMAHNHPLWLILILALPLAGGHRGLARGMEDGTLEVVLAQPISRTAYYLALASMLVIGVTLTLIFSTLGGLTVTWLMELPGEIRTGKLIELAVSGWALALSVTGLTLFFSAGAGGRSPGMWAVGVVVFFFFARFLANAWSWFSWAGAYSIFNYHDPQKVLDEGLSPVSLAILLGVALLCGAAGLVLFRRRQLLF